jgi:hypothetical protein
MNRQEMARLGGIGLKFTPNSRHVRIHCSGLRVEIITPRGIQDSITSERTVNILKKVQPRLYSAGVTFTSSPPRVIFQRPTSTVTSANRNIWSTTRLDLLGKTALPWLGIWYMPGGFTWAWISITSFIFHDAPSSVWSVVMRSWARYLQQINGSQQTLRLGVLKYSLQTGRRDPLQSVLSHQVFLRCDLGPGKRA